jgi:hypothetical protein
LFDAACAHRARSPEVASTPPQRGEERWRFPANRQQILRYRDVAAALYSDVAARRLVVDPGERPQHAREVADLAIVDRPQADNASIRQASRTF